MKTTGKSSRRWLAWALIAVLALVLAQPMRASAEAVVIHPGDNPDCTFEPGDIPGVDVFFPATCTLVFTPSGNVEIVAHGHLPAGYSLSETFVGTLPCFGGTGRVVATTSGEVNATCHFR